MSEYFLKEQQLGLLLTSQYYLWKPEVSGMISSNCWEENTCQVRVLYP